MLELLGPRLCSVSRKTREPTVSDRPGCKCRLCGTDRVRDRRSSGFFQLLQACYAVGNGTVWLEQWEVPGQVASTRFDGFGMLNAGGALTPVVLVLDRVRIPIAGVLPLARSAALALTRFGGGIVLIAGADCERTSWLCDRAGSCSRFDALKLVPVGNPDTVANLLATLAAQTREATPDGNASLGGGGKLGPLPNVTAAAEKQVAAARASLAPVAIELLDDLADHVGVHAGIIVLGTHSSRAAVHRRLRSLVSAGLIVQVPDGHPRRFALTVEGVRLLSVRDGWRSASAYARVRVIWFVGGGDRGLNGPQDACA